jgi:hypothetical protein
MLSCVYSITSFQELFAATAGGQPYAYTGSKAQRAPASLLQTVRTFGRKTIAITSYNGRWRHREAISPGSATSVTGAAVSSTTASSPASARSTIRDPYGSVKAVSLGSVRSAWVYLSAAAVAAAALACLQLIYMSAPILCSCAEAPLGAR